MKNISIKGILLSIFIIYDSCRLRHLSKRLIRDAPRHVFVDMAYQHMAQLYNFCVFKLVFACDVEVLLIDGAFKNNIARRLAEDEYSVRKQQRFVNVMGDEEDCLFGVFYGHNSSTMT